MYVAGVNSDSSRIAKHKRTTKLDTVKPEVGSVEVGASTGAGRVVD